MSRIRKNKKFIDPRYFMDEKMETLNESDTKFADWVQANVPDRTEQGEYISIYNECQGDIKCMVMKNTAMVSILRAVGMMPQAYEE